MNTKSIGLKVLKRIFVVLGVGIIWSGTALHTMNAAAEEKSATVIVLQPQQFDPSTGRQPSDSQSVLRLQPSTILLINSEQGGKSISLPLSGNQTYYLLCATDTKSQQMLGDALFKSGNSLGALTAYRTALALDTAIMASIYKNYSLLIAENGKPAEVIKTLNQMIAAGRGDTSTYAALGRTYIRLKDFAKASEIYEKLLKQYPNSYTALSGLALAQQKSGDIESATTTLQQALKVNPDAVSDYRVLGDCFQAQNQSEKAIEAYSQFIDKGGVDPVIAEKVGSFYYSQKSFERAIKYFSLVKGAAAANPNHQFMLGDAYFQTGEYKNAIPPLSTAAVKTPVRGLKIEIARKLTEACLNIDDQKRALGWFTFYRKLNKKNDEQSSYLQAFFAEKQTPARAIKLYEANTRLFPDDYRNYLRLGLLFAKNKATRPKAVDYLKNAAARADTIASIWLEIAKVWGKIGNGEEELKAYQKYLRADPENVEANIRIGSLLLDRNNQEGIQFLETAAQKEPSNSNIMVILAKGYIKISRYKEALTILTKAQSMDSTNSAIKDNLIIVYRNLNMNSQALAEIQKKLAKKREPAILLQYAQILLQDGKNEDAMNAIEDILAVNPENIEAIMIKVSILKSQQKYDEAIEVCKEVASLDPNYAPAYFERAEMYRFQNKILWAEKYYNNTLKIDPGYGLAELGLAEIAALRNDQKEYRNHVEKAYELTPNDPSIAAKYKKLR